MLLCAICFEAKVQELQMLMTTFINYIQEVFIVFSTDGIPISKIIN